MRGKFFSRYTSGENFFKVQSFFNKSSDFFEKSDYDRQANFLFLISNLMSIERNVRKFEAD